MKEPTKGSLNDAPGSIRVLTRDANALGTPPTNGNGLLKLTAVSTAGRHTIANRSHISEISRIGIVPANGFAQLGGVRLPDGRIDSDPVDLIHRTTDLAADKRADQNAGPSCNKLPVAATELCTEQATKRRAGEPPQALLRPIVIRNAASN
jgi:hypothetical protein